MNKISSLTAQTITLGRFVFFPRGHDVRVNIFLRKHFLNVDPDQVTLCRAGNIMVFGFFWGFFGSGSRGNIF